MCSSQLAGLFGLAFFETVVAFDVSEVGLHKSVEGWIGKVEEEGIFQFVEYLVVVGTEGREQLLKLGVK